MRDIYETTDYRRFLLAALEDHGLQQRDLARAIDRAPSAVSLMLSGLRGLDPELVERTARLLELDADRTAYLAALVDLDSRSPRARRAAWATVQATQRHRAEAGLAPEVLEAASRWYFSVIMELAGCDGFRPEPAWIAGTLLPPISVAQAEEALTTAIRIGVLVPDDDGGLMIASEVHWTPPDVGGSREAPRAAELHEACMALAAGCLTRSRHNERHVSTTVFRVSERQFERIRARLREVERELVLLASEPEGSPTRVYQVGVQLYPVTLFSDSTADHSMFVSSQGAPPDIEPDTTE